MHKLFYIVFFALPLFACEDPRACRYTAQDWIIAYLPQIRDPEQRQVWQKYVALRKGLNDLSNGYCEQQVAIQKEQEKIKTDANASLAYKKLMNSKRATFYSASYKQYKYLEAELEVRALFSGQHALMLDALAKLDDFIPSPYINILEKAAQIDEPGYQKLMNALATFHPR